MRCPNLNTLPAPPLGKTGWPWTVECPQLPSVRADGSSWPRISIVTPSYNQGQFIEETIRSILLQGYPDIEYIVMDGGSTDATIEVLERYKFWISHLQSRPDGGQSSAIAAGFKLSTGAVLTWMNSDDGLMPFSLQTVGAIIGAKMILIGNSVYKNGSEAHYIQTIVFPRFFRAIGGAIPQHSTFWHRSIHVDPRPEIVCAMDFELWLRMITSLTIVKRIDLALGYANIHDGQKQANPKFEKAWESDKKLIEEGSSYLRAMKLFLPILARLFYLTKRVQDLVHAPKETVYIERTFPNLKFNFPCKSFDPSRRFGDGKHGA